MTTIAKLQKEWKQPSLLERLKPVILDGAVCSDLKRAASREWVITNGIGGYASSTVAGMNTRRSHGLLVAAMNPPVGRMVILSKVEEELVLPHSRQMLSVNQYGSDVIHPEGFRYLTQFRLDPWPVFVYRTSECVLEKSVWMLPGENATVIGYRILQAPSPVELWVRPLVALRDFRDLRHERTSPPPSCEQGPDWVAVRMQPGLPECWIHHNAEWVEWAACWYKNFEYAEERSLGPMTGYRKTDLNWSREDLWSFGNLRYLLKEGETGFLVASTGRQGMGDFSFHARRVENTQAVLAQSIRPPGKGPLATRLSWTADSFVVRRRADSVSGRHSARTDLMAGWPWFTPWGRDALVALPGLTLSTGRPELAREILQTLVSHMRGGLIPVRFSEADATPQYDSADTALWFFWAVWHYWQKTDDLKFIRKSLWDPMREIIQAYLRGTGFGITAGEDGLIDLSDPDRPLTWMDARLPSDEEEVLPGLAVTPRSGKPVEVNALWYCALEIMAHLADEIGFHKSGVYARFRGKIRRSFMQQFWSEPEQFLYDRVTPQGPDRSIRPNMLIAASLPFTPLTRRQIAAIVALTRQQLLTPSGVRTLTPLDSRYRGRYEGDFSARAEAYHQGTVWTWLIGPYVSAALKAAGNAASERRRLADGLRPFSAYLQQGCLGSLPELFDGDSPHRSRGGPSQAWSVGEMLRAIEQTGVSDL